MTSVADHILYVSKAGKDANDGRSWESAKKTIQAAIDLLTGDGIVNVGAGEYQENVVMKQQILLRGVPGFGDKGAVVRAATVDGTCITIPETAHRASVDGIGTRAFSAAFTGKGISLGGSNCSIAHYQHFGIGKPTQTTGGTGLYAHAGEGSVLYDIKVTLSNRALHLTGTFSNNVLRSITSSQCYQTLISDGEPGAGGNTFDRWKATVNEPLQPGDYSVWCKASPTSGNAGGDWFLRCDWTEEFTFSGRVRIDTFDNHFLGCIVAPRSIWEINGNNNVLDHLYILGNGGKVTVSGRFNKLVNISRIGELHITGTDNYLSTISYAGSYGGTKPTTAYPQTFADGNLCDWPVKYFVQPHSQNVNPAIDEGNVRDLTVPTTAAFKILNPYNFFQPFRIPKGAAYTWIIRNGSGGTMGKITWEPKWRLAGPFTNPANGKARTISFVWDGAEMLETHRSVADL